MIGKRFGKLIVLENAESRNGVLWLCKCDCGGYKKARTGHLNAGSPRSCGCDKYHGHGGTGNRSREYISYHNMVARCTNPNNKRYKDYGELGITICKSWLESFTNFLSDMGECPIGYQIDRIDNRLGYFPENCRWVDAKTNMNNRSISKKYVVEGIEYESSSVAAKQLDVSASTVIAWCKGRTVKEKGSGGEVKERFYPPRQGCFVKHIYPNKG
jgi:hypothetical protein